MSRLNRILDQCDGELLKSYITSNPTIRSPEAILVLKWIRNHRTAGVENITPLQGAVTYGFHSLCQILIQENVDLNSHSSIPHPLCITLSKGNVIITKMLIEAGANVNLPFGNMYPLAYAMGNPNCSTEILKLIIDAGFPKDSIINMESKMTALHKAAIQGRQEYLSYLLSICADPNLKDSKGFTPLHYAAQFNKTEIVDILIQHGAIIDTECDMHITPLMYGISGTHYNMVKLLIELGASLNYLNHSNENPMKPLYFAAVNLQFRIVQLLLDKNAEVNEKIELTHRTPLHVAAAANYSSRENEISLNCIVELFIKNGADMNCPDKYGFTPLDIAIRSKNLGVAKILVRNFCTLNNITNLDTTTFHRVAGTVDLELITLCLERGANMMSKDKDGRYPIHHLLHTYLEKTSREPTPNFDICLSILKLFWKYGFPYDKLSMESGINFPEEISSCLQTQRLLFNGLKSMNIKIVKDAITQGAEIKCCSTDVPFPVHLIASKGNNDILKLFLSRGVSVNILDEHGETPLHIASKLGHVNCCLALLEYGAIFNCISKISQKTPLCLAKEHNHTEVIKLLKTIASIFNNFKENNVKRAPDIKILYAVMNCKCRSGDTLLTRALKLRSHEVAVRLMDLRLNAMPLL